MESRKGNLPRGATTKTTGSTHRKEKRRSSARRPWRTMADEALALDHALDCLREYEYDHISRSDYIRHKREHSQLALQPPNPKSRAGAGAEQELGTRAPWPSSIHPQFQRPLPVGPHTLTSDPAGRALQRARRSRAPLDPSSALHLCPLCPFRVGHLRAVTPLARS